MSHPALKTKQTWEDLVAIIGSFELHKLGRSREDLEVYRSYMKKVREEWHNLADYIAMEKFEGFTKVCTTREGVEKFTVSPPLNKNGMEEVVVLKTNDFPYHTEIDVEHFVLWVLNRDVTEEDVEKAKEEVRE